MLLFFVHNVVFDVLLQQVSSVLCSSFNLSGFLLRWVCAHLFDSSRQVLNEQLLQVMERLEFTSLSQTNVQVCQKSDYYHHIIRSPRRCRYSRRSPPDPSCPAWSAPDARAETCRNSVNMSLKRSLLLTEPAFIWYKIQQKHIQKNNCSIWRYFKM